MKTKHFRGNVLLWIAIAAIVFAGAAVVVPASAQHIPPPRYQVIADIATMESDIKQLKEQEANLRESLHEANSRIAGLTLLRAHDIQLAEAQRAEDIASWQAARAEDRKRIVSLERDVKALFEGCR